MNRHLGGVGVKCLGLLGLTLAMVGRAAATHPAQEAKDGASAKPSTPRVLVLPDPPFTYTDLQLPAHFKTTAAQQHDNTPPDNPVTDAGATLGRVLFYDTRLSANNTVACASCHNQKHAFGGPVRFSKGFEGKVMDRHAMPLGNVRYYQRGRFFWDERAATLEVQVLTPIQSKLEMGMTLTKLTELLSKDPHYPELFNKAFGSKEITSKRVARALAQFLRSMVSYRSKFDEGMAKAFSVRDDFPNFTLQENRGKAVFLQRCANCHLPGNQNAHFFMNQPFNNGLDTDFLKTDGGVGEISLQPGDLGRFKSPSLRNVEFTGFYMHDGRFDSLDKVIDHYSKGGKNHPNADGRVRGINLDGPQRAALGAFLRTLSDPQFIADPKYADPFQ
jgi:cytochrome c peroxidase